jgi:GNAT superfamily N-acetyltransferase
MKVGRVELGDASIRIAHSQIIPPTKRGLARELTEFFVPEDKRGQGAGSALLAEVCEQADSDNILLIVIADTERLALFYARHGFKELPRDDGASAIIMARPAKKG